MHRSSHSVSTMFSGSGKNASPTKTFSDQAREDVCLVSKTIKMRRILGFKSLEHLHATVVEMSKLQKLFDQPTKVTRSRSTSLLAHYLLKHHAPRPGVVQNYPSNQLPGNLLPFVLRMSLQKDARVTSRYAAKFSRSLLDEAMKHGTVTLSN